MARRQIAVRALFASKTNLLGSASKLASSLLERSAALACAGGDLIVKILLFPLAPLSTGPALLDCGLASEYRPPLVRAKHPDRRRFSLAETLQRGRLRRLALDSLCSAADFYS